MIHFQSATGGKGTFPVTPGDAIGIYVAGEPRSIGEIAGLSKTGEIFAPYDENVGVITGRTHIHAWIRLPLTNPHPEARSHVLQVDYRWVNLAVLYLPDGVGGYQAREKGDTLPGRAAESNALSPAFEFTLEPNESQVLFLKLQDAYWLQPSLTFWEDPLAFHQRALDVSRFIHAYIGMMAGLFVANLCVFIAFRYRDLGYYLLFLAASSALHCLNFNLFSVYRAEWMRADAILIDPGVDFFRFDGLLLITAGLLLLFTSEFLQLKRLSGRLERSVLGASCLLLALGPIVMFGPADLAGDQIRVPVAILWSLSNLFALGLGFYAWSRGHSQARFFIPALLLLVVASWRFNYHTLSNQLVMTEVIQQWVYASSLEMVIFSIGLIDRFLGVVREKEAAQATALQEAKGHADLQQRYNTELVATVEQQTRDLSHTLDQKNRLITYLAHDMRAPLHGLVSLSAMLARSPGKLVGEDLNRYATEIEHNARGVSELMENLLSWARLQSGDLQLHHQEYLVDDLFEATLQTVRTQASLKDVELVLETPPDCFVQCDFTAIVTVLRNLMSNAIKFSPPAESVVMRVESDESRIRIAIEDRGEGLSAEQLTAIETEEPSLSTIGSKGENGAGLGLGICRDLLRLHDSRLGATNRSGSGACFFFYLPRA